MRGVVSAAVPVCYVSQLDRSREFYSLFGYVEQRSGKQGDSSWAYLQCGDLTLMLAAVQPLLIHNPLPLLIYLFVDDVAAVIDRLRAAGHQADHVGYPDHAPGGEARTADPDGNVVVVGQRVAMPGDVRVTPSDDDARFSLIKQAAEAVSRRGEAPSTCQIGVAGGQPCTQPAEVKLADPWGETVWGCIDHVEEALLNARSAFIATEDGQGLGPYLQSRRTRS